MCQSALEGRLKCRPCYWYLHDRHRKVMMARGKNEWASKVFALIKSGQLPAAVAQIKVAPTVADLTRLQTLLETLPSTPAQKQLDKVLAEELALLAAPRLHRSP